MSKFVKLFCELMIGTSLFFVWMHGIFNWLIPSTQRWIPVVFYNSYVLRDNVFWIVFLLVNLSLPAIVVLVFHEISFLAKFNFSALIISIVLASLILIYGWYLDTRPAFLNLNFAVCLIAALLNVATFIILNHLYKFETIGRVVSVVIVAANILLFLFLRLASL